MPSGVIQFENGFAATGKAGERTFDVPETQVRFGAASRTELRLTLPNVLADDEPASAIGIADMSVGLKQQFLRRPSGNASLIVAVSLPTGSADVSSHGFDPSVHVPWSASVNQWTIAGMFSISVPTIDTRRSVAGQASFLIDRLLTSRWSAFLEYSADIPKSASATGLLHAGASFRPTNDHQVDIHAGVGLPAGTDWLIGAGYSLRIGVGRHRSPITR